MAKETNKGEYKEFRRLLRRGIGTRTQKAFAEEINISKEHLNRLLNNPEIPRPPIGLLRNMAAHMKTITERMLLESCGYEMEPIEERAKRCEKEISNGLKELINVDYNSQPWRSVEDALRMVVIPHIREEGKMVFGKEGTCKEGSHKWAEKEMHFAYHWGGGDHDCATSSTIYFAKTENGNIFFLDYNVGETEVRKKEMEGQLTAEERLLKAIFGEEDEDRVVTTVFGYGFPFPATPNGFVDFLSDHRGVFCTTKDRSQMLLSIIDDGKDPDEVFAEFETDKYGAGTGGAVAEILSNELGVYFYFYQHDDLLDDESSPSVLW